MWVPKSGEKSKFHLNKQIQTDSRSLLWCHWVPFNLYVGRVRQPSCPQRKTPAGEEKGSVMSGEQMKCGHPSFSSMIQSGYKDDNEEVENQEADGAGIWLIRSQRHDSTLGKPFLSPSGVSSILKVGPDFGKQAVEQPGPGSDISTVAQWLRGTCWTNQGCLDSSYW